MKTAEDFLQDSLEISHFYNDKYGAMCCFSSDVQKAMIEFAKMHVQAALREANMKAQIEEYGYSINSASILDAYPESNIK